MDTPHTFLLIDAVVIPYNLGTIWFAQAVVYPSLHEVGGGEYAAYHRDYVRRIPLPLIVPGFLSFTLPMVLVLLRPDAVPTWIVIANALCAGISFFVTVVPAIPRHFLPENGDKQPQVVADLAAYNWPRTAAI